MRYRSFLSLFLVTFWSISLCNTVLADAVSQQSNETKQSVPQKMKSDENNSTPDTIKIENSRSGILDNIVKGATIYVVVGAAAFATGMVATVIWISYMWLQTTKK